FAGGLVDGEPVYDVGIEDADAPVCDGAHGQLLVPGYPELANTEHVEWCIQAACNGKSHGHTAPRQGENDDVGGVGQMAQLSGQNLAGLVPVLIDPRRATPSIHVLPWCYAAGTVARGSSAGQD